MTILKKFLICYTSNGGGESDTAHRCGALKSVNNPAAQAGGWRFLMTETDNFDQI